jgi:transcriptional regulator with XRE-family HTH domain
MRLGRDLRTARLAKGLSQSQVAKRLKCGQAKINKIETTLVTIKLNELDMLIALYELPDGQARLLRELASEAFIDRPQRGKASVTWSAFTALSDGEISAEEMHCWHSERIPGPLQSQRYMLGLYRSAPLSSAEVTTLVRQWKARAEVFAETGPRYRVILSESSLLRVPGGRSSGLAADQAEHLLKLCKQQPRLELQILTFDADVDFVDSDFEILRFADEKREDFAYIEYPSGSRPFKKSEDLAMFRAHWDQLHQAALSPEDTVLFLEQFMRNGGELGAS